VDASVGVTKSAGSEFDGFVRVDRRAASSVFLAEQLAKRLRAKNGVEVAVRHLELEKMGNGTPPNDGRQDESPFMKAMILAAGRGRACGRSRIVAPKRSRTRGRTLLEITLLACAPSDS